MEDEGVGTEDRVSVDGGRFREEENEYVTMRNEWEKSKSKK